MVLAELANPLAVGDERNDSGPGTVRTHIELLAVHFFAGGRWSLQKNKNGTISGVQ